MLAIELHNTLYAAGGAIHDALATQASADAWLDALGERVPAGRPGHDALIALRAAIRAALQAALAGTAPDPEAVAAINRASAGAPYSPTLRWDGSEPELEADYHGVDGGRVVLATLAWDAIDLLTGPRRAALRACGAPGCVLLFLKDHPRREWCSNACGNRARQARHQARRRA